MKKSLIIPAVVLSAALAACGSPTATGGDSASTVDAHAQEVYDQINGMTSQERTDKLVELAEAEGELSLYTSNTDMDDIVDAFSEKYDVDVSTYRGNSETILQRVLQESSAGFQGVDLVETNAGELDIIARDGLFYDYESEFRNAVRAEGQKDGWTADRFNAFIVAWNTEKVKAADEPTSLEDFAKPEWKGRVSMELGDVDWYATVRQHLVDEGKTEVEADELFAKIAANAKIAKGHTVQAELLAAGEFEAGVSMYSHSTQSGQDDGQPITWHPSGDKEPIQPIVIRPNGAGLMGNAAHPAAAMLFLDFLLTEGQDLILAANRVPAVPGKADPLAGLETIPVDEEEMLDNGDAWNKKYEELTSHGEPE